jgi:hypothetical protein
MSTGRRALTTALAGLFISGALPPRRKNLALLGSVQRDVRDPARTFSGLFGLEVLQ